MTTGVTLDTSGDPVGLAEGEDIGEGPSIEKTSLSISTGFDSTLPRERTLFRNSGTLLAGNGLSLAGDGSAFAADSRRFVKLL